MVPAQMMVFDREIARRTASRSTPSDAVAAARLAIWAHMELVRIHPFQEGNGRTARLIADTIVMRYITGATRPLEWRVEEKDRYLRCVNEARRGSAEAFGAYVADMLERLLNEEEERAARLTFWSRIRRGGPR